MCFGGSKPVAMPVQTAPIEQEQEQANKKGRLLFTEGQNAGQELQAKQGASIRKVFGN
jgi:hypothetical protein